MWVYGLGSWRMYMANNGLKPVVAQPGQPLYQTVKQTVREAIDSGIFRAGEQMPSTKELSETLSVSLVTAHRALQELVMAGVLDRKSTRLNSSHVAISYAVFC